MINNSKEKFKVWQRKDGIIVGEFWGEQSEEGAKEFVEQIAELMETTKGKRRILIDATEGGRSGIRARKVYVGFAKSIKEMDKVTIFGLGVLTKVVATFIVRAAGRKNVKFFLTEEEAIKWLKEEKI